MSLTHDIFQVVLVLLAIFGFFAWIPVVLILRQADRRQARKKRPVNEVLRDAVAEGRITVEEFSGMLDEVHNAMGGVDAPYPQVREFQEKAR